MKFNLVCELSQPVCADDTSEAVNRLLAEYIARSAEGRAKARSDGPGNGTEFVVELPAH